MHIELKENEIKACQKFSQDVVKETYNRFGRNLYEREKRICIGKYGEMIFLKFLNCNSIYPKCDEMFEIYEGQTNVDSFDFLTKDGEKIDIKTAYEPYHKRILIPFDQFERGNAKDYYVGVFYELTQNRGEILGYCTKEDLMSNPKTNFGEGPAYWFYLKDLKDISELVKLI